MARVPGSLADFRVVEDLRHKPHAVMALEFVVLVAVDDDARAFLPAMLQGIETKKGDLRRMGVTKNSKHSTLILGTVLKHSLRRG